MTGDSRVLDAAGWYTGRDAGDEATAAVLEVAALGWEPFPVALEAVRAWHGLRIGPCGSGVDVAPTGVVVDPREARYTAGSFRRLGTELGVRLFPFGRTDSDVPLVVDELGRLFSVDHGGYRMAGAGVPEGLVALAEGRMPVRLVARRASWTLPPFPDGELLAGAVGAALSLVYVLHRAGAYSARALRVRATTLRGIGVLALDRTFPLPPGSLEAAAEPLTAGIAEALAAAGVQAAGAELRVSVPPPPTTTAPLASFGCALALGSSASRSTAGVLTLAAGPGACVGRAAEVFDACAADFDRFTACTAFTR